MAWLHNKEQQARALMAGLQDDTQKEFIYAFSKAIQHQTLGDAYYMCKPCANSPGTCTKTHPQEKQLIGPYYDQEHREQIMTTHVPIPSTRAEIQEQLPQLIEAQNKIAVHTQLHTHTNTCDRKKESVPTDANCRLIRPRLTVHTNGDPDHLDTILLPRKKTKACLLNSMVPYPWQTRAITAWLYIYSLCQLL